MDAKTYTWSQFTAAVTALLPVDSARIGSIPALIGLWTRQAVIEIQRLIDAFRTGHETLYHASDFVLEGYAARATLPPQGKLRGSWLVIYDKDQNGKALPNCKRHSLDSYDYGNRMALVHGKVAVNDGRGVICIDPQVRYFYVYPGVKDCQAVSVFWDGIKTEFQPDELTPFTEAMTQVVADYVKSRIALEVDKDIPLSEKFNEMYKDGRGLLYVGEHERILS